ncbi:MAG: hypothetical protein M1113_04745 [Candidatus Thermoplasmatota archaeon]|nr:hypothetical protein [Candidatus Thermoplasmatota archaeon]
MAKPKKNKWKVRDFILWHTQFYETCTIHERDLVKAVNEEYDLSYQLNRFQDLYIDKMPQFRKYTGEDGYWVYQRTDINPDPDWTMERLKQFEESYMDQKWYDKHGEFLYLLEFARKNNDKDSENYILMEKVLELMEKEDKD